MTDMQRFTVYRRDLAARGTHNELQANDDNEPQWEGVIWSDGTVTIRWLTPCGSHAIWNRIDDCLAIHGHPEYGTEIICHDGPAPECWVRAVHVHKYEESTS